MADEQDMSGKVPSQTKGTILVAEDNVDIGNMLVLCITQETPYQVRLVESAYEALRAVREIQPILFLLDYHLPSMTGIQLYDQLHMIESLKHVPTIMMSANLPMTELDRRKIVGLKKPFDLDELLYLIERSLGKMT